jgi:hypothetical protein
MFGAPASSTFFSARIELAFERNTSCKSEFSRVERFNFFQIGIFCYVEEIHASKKEKHLC